MTITDSERRCLIREIREGEPLDECQRLASHVALVAGQEITCCVQHAVWYAQRGCQIRPWREIVPEAM